MAAHLSSWLPAQYSPLFRRPSHCSVNSSSAGSSHRIASQYQASTSAHACMPASQSCCEGRQVQQRRGVRCRMSMPRSAPAQICLERARPHRVARNTSLQSVSPLALAVLAPAISEAGPQPHPLNVPPTGSHPNSMLGRLPQTPSPPCGLKARTNAACRSRRDWRLRCSFCTS